MHVMLDLETWGTKPGCAIRSIGAVPFDLESGIIRDDMFYRNIDAKSCSDAGLTKDHATITWWGKQKQETQDIFLKDPKPLAEALSDFFSWFQQVEGAQIWSQGANFDIPILEAAFDITGVSMPWKFWNARDTRTVYDIADFKYHEETRGGVEHYALDDCLHQITLVRAAMERLGK